MYMYTLMRRMFFKQSGFQNVLGCVDGTVIRIQTPSEKQWKRVRLRKLERIFIFECPGISFFFCYYNTPINIFRKRVTSGPGQGHPDIAILTNWLAKSKSTKQKQDFYDRTRIYIFKNLSNLKNYVRSAFS